MVVCRWPTVSDVARPPWGGDTAREDTRWTSSAGETLRDDVREITARGVLY
jgi:hypothetical protein